MNEDVISKAAFMVSLDMLGKLKAEPLPVSFGRSKYFESMLPKRDLDDVLDESCPYWWGYAETMREFKQCFESLPKQEFKAKR